MIFSNVLTETVKSGIHQMLKDKAKTATVISVVTAIFGTAETINATIKAVRLLDEAKEEKGEELTTKEKAQIIVPTYAKSAILVGTSIGTTIFSQYTNQQAISNLAGIAAASAAEYRDYRYQTKAIAGEETEKEIMNAVIKEREDRAQPYINANQTIVVDETTRAWFYEPISGRKFESTINRIEKGINDFNFDMYMGMEMDKSLNDLLEQWDQPPMPDTGDELNFDLDTGGAELSQPYESTIIDGKSYILLTFRRPPRY